ncbi:hypothetical protein DFP83_102376 [Idiomarina fontislapidosi]|uniref:Cellulose biosynthesis protein BcsF n=1 Tax=Idiomarina fontislapidosi TaxID=263723 RepID=A0A432Y8W5_9GAMM|nr:hypothetical protein DFP83_102376 [Idiomarina fontislapidosi]RUO57418.1 hypothetical protein CWE25_02855 [Idiomarina fontislapidosi]|tara:strand:- start:2516 stop:2710 length:195 start_codon:yes stop_codon:yes gene_type:complete
MPEHVAELYIILSFILGVLAGWLTLASWRWIASRLASLTVRFGFVRIISKPRRNKPLKGSEKHG